MVWRIPIELSPGGFGNKPAFCLQTLIDEGLF